MTAVRYGLKLSACAAGLAISTSGFGATRSYLDVTAAVGASSNPPLGFDSRASVFGRLSALGMHEWRSERTTASVTGYAENTTYLSGNGSTQLFDLRANVVHAASPTVSIFASAGFQGDKNGQLSNRFTTAPPNFLSPTPVQPDQPVQPDPIVIDDNGRFTGLDGRHYRLNAEAGVNVRVSARGSISLSAGAQRSFSSGSGNQQDYNSYFGTASWQMQFTERTSGGLSANVQYQDYDNGLSATVVNPLATVSHQFTDQIYGSASVGLLFTKQDQFLGGSDSSIDPSFSFRLCKNTERERFCGRVSRDARNSLNAFSAEQAGALTISTLVAVDYSRQIDANQSIQASLTGSRSTSQQSIGDDFRSTYLTLLVGYDRKVRQRLAVGAQAGARKFFQSGPDPKFDVNANAYVRYRFGDVQ